MEQALLHIHTRYFSGRMGTQMIQLIECFCANLSFDFEKSGNRSCNSTIVLFSVQPRRVVAAVDIN